MLTNNQLQNIITNTFKTHNGKKLLEFFDEEYSNRDSVVKGDPYMTHYNEGQRSVVNLIKEYMKGDYDE